MCGLTDDERDLMRVALGLPKGDGSLYPVAIHNSTQGLPMDEKLERVLRDILNAYDGGAASCVGATSTGEKVWKGSFVAYMERLRDALPPTATSE